MLKKIVNSLHFHKLVFYIKKAFIIFTLQNKKLNANIYNTIIFAIKKNSKPFCSCRSLCEGLPSELQAPSFRLIESAVGTWMTNTTVYGSKRTCCQ